MVSFWSAIIGLLEDRWQTHFSFPTPKGKQIHSRSDLIPVSQSVFKMGKCDWMQNLLQLKCNKDGKAEQIVSQSPPRLFTAILPSPKRRSSILFGCLKADDRSILKILFKFVWWIWKEPIEGRKSYPAQNKLKFLISKRTEQWHTYYECS